MHLRLQDYDVRMRYEQLSTQDTLSDILNKKAAVEAVKHYLRGHNPHVVCALLILDIDDFKLVNDTYGHAFGDLTLATAGECIQSVFGRAGDCYRIGGDEFCAILSYNKSAHPDSLLADFIHAVELQQQKDPRFPYISAGYAHFMPGENQIADALKTADTYMYLRKRNAKEKRAAHQKS